MKSSKSPDVSANAVVLHLLLAHPEETGTIGRVFTKVSLREKQPIHVSLHPVILWTWFSNRVSIANDVLPKIYGISWFVSKFDFR